MNWGNTASVPVATARQWFRLDTGAFIVATFIIVLGFFLLYPVVLILGLSFNTAAEFFAVERVWGLGNWWIAFSKPRIFQGLFNTVCPSRLKSQFRKSFTAFLWGGFRPTQIFVEVLPERWGCPPIEGRPSFC